LGEEEYAAVRDYIYHKRASISTQKKNDQVYLPLAPGEIRVLELYPDKFENDLSGALHVVSVDFEYKEKVIAFGTRPLVSRLTIPTNHAISLVDNKIVWYTALSYVWGPPQFDVEFHLKNGSGIKITTSLNCALQHLRTEEQSVWLWIDQLCIKPKDVREKEQQIPLMGLIYRHATNTVIWLGDDGSDNPSIAFNTLDRVNSRLELSFQQVTPEDFKRLLLPEAEDAAWREVRQLFRRPWFTRLWVIQEALLSINLYVKCGNATIAWEDLAAWCGAMEYSGLFRWMSTDTEVNTVHGTGSGKSLLPATGGSVVFNLQAERDLYRSTELSGDVRILGVLVSTRYAQSFEPKDKVYGVLAITKTDIVPKYSSDFTTRQVYLETCLPLVPLAVFSLMSCVDHETPLRPSWIPDWSSPRLTAALGYSTKSRAIYSAGGPTFNPATGKAFPINFQLDKQEGILTLPGKIFDAIAILGPVLSTPALDIDDPAHVNKDLMASVKIAKERSSYPSGCTVFDAYWQTMVAGSDESGNAKAPPEFSEVFSLVLDSSTGNMPSLPGQIYSPRRKKGFYTLNSLRYRQPQKTLEELRRSFVAAAHNRRFVVTDKGYFALVPRGARIGDSICVLERGHVPFVIRPGGTRDGYEMLGESYVHGIMQGEVMEIEDILLEHVVFI
jgi:hypothetical protein